MLRSKQVATLSQCARSFYLASSRFGTVDGASCTSSEDENANPILNGKQSVLVSYIGKAVSSDFKDAAKNVASHHPSHGHGCQDSFTHLTSPRSSVKADGLSSSIDSLKSDTHCTDQTIVHSAKLVSDQFVDVGVATVGVLSDLMNNRLPSINGSSIPAMHMYMADASRSVSKLKSSNATLNQEPSMKCSSNKRIGSKSNTSTHCDNLKVKSERPATQRNKQNTSSSILDASVDVTGQPYHTQNRSQVTTQQNKPRFNTNQNNVFATKGSKGKVIVSESERLDKSQRSIKSLNRRGATSSIRSYAHAVNPVQLFADTLQRMKWGPIQKEALSSLGYRLDPFHANQVLKSLQDHSIALGFFDWLKSQPGFKHDQHTYTTMIGILGKSQQFTSMTRLLEEMARNGCQPNVVTYNRLVHGYGRANYIKEAMGVFHQMQEVGCEPDHVTYCTLIDIHAKAGYIEAALDLYQKMLEAGLFPDTFTYSVMINCLGKAGNLPAAYKLFCEMIERGCVPNLVTYNIMIALQAKARNYPSALNLYRSMRDAGFHPDKITYSIVMEALGHCGRLDEAESVFMEMKQDCVPDVPVYGLLIDLWGKAGNLDRALVWYQSMLDAGLRPNVPTFNSLLSAFLRANRLSDAFNVLQNMIGLGLCPSLQTYTLLLSCCTETRFHLEFWCQLLAVTGHPAHAFLLFLPAAEPGGQNVRDHANAFLDLMHSEDRESKRGLVDAVVDFLHKSGFKEEAGSVWEVAAQRNVFPDAVREKRSAHWLINLHVMSDGTAVTALSRTLAWFRRQMIDTGVGPERIDIVTGWGRRSRVAGTSLVRQAVSDLLHLFRFPLYTENGNSGCFVGCGQNLRRWLLPSYVERMHLL